MGFAGPLRRAGGPDVLPPRKPVLIESLPVLSEGRTVLEERANYRSLHIPWFSLSRKAKPRSGSLPSSSLALWMREKWGSSQEMIRERRRRLIREGDD